MKQYASILSGTCDSNVTYSLDDQEQVKDNTNEDRQRLLMEAIGLNSTNTKKVDELLQDLDLDILKC